MRLRRDICGDRLRGQTRDDNMPDKIAGFRSCTCKGFPAESTVSVETSKSIIRPCCRLGLEVSFCFGACLRNRAPAAKSVPTADLSRCTKPRWSLSPERIGAIEATAQPIHQCQVVAPHPEPQHSKNRAAAASSARWPCAGTAQQLRSGA